MYTVPEIAARYTCARTKCDSISSRSLMISLRSWRLRRLSSSPSMLRARRLFILQEEDGENRNQHQPERIAGDLGELGCSVR